MRKLIRHDGTTVDFDRPLTMRDIETLIGCAICDSVVLADGVHVMCLDDWAALRELPVNHEASRLYWEKCGGPVDWVISGNVVIVPDADFEMPARPL